MEKRRKGLDYPGITVCMFCHDGNGRVFMNKRSTNCRDEHGRWDICGGSVDHGKTIEETMRAELLEEYRAEPIEAEFLGTRELFRKDEDGDPTHWIALDFKVRIDPAVATNGEPHKFEEVRWFPIDAIPEPVHSALPSFIERYRARLAT